MSTPASSTEPAVGASVCASGSQVCSGHAGSLTAKAAKNPSIRSMAVLAAIGVPSSCVKSKVYTPVARPWMNTSATIATSMSRPLTCVKMKNLIAECTRRSWPHTAIRKYIGMSIISKKK